MEYQPIKIVAVLNDLMFTVKIQEAARRAGLDVVFVKTAEHALEHAKEKPAAVILDLNNSSGDALELIVKL
jgi:DNA-binding response OmpR family regulator